MHAACVIPVCIHTLSFVENRERAATGTMQPTPVCARKPDYFDQKRVHCGPAIASGMQAGKIMSKPSRQFIARLRYSRREEHLMYPALGLKGGIEHRLNTTKYVVNRRLFLQCKHCGSYVLINTEARVQDFVHGTTPTTSLYSDPPARPISTKCPLRPGDHEWDLGRED
jgi:hypothetical protein